MPFLTPQYLGHKEGTEFLASQNVTWEDDYTKKGQENVKRYNEEASQQRYLQGWKKAWDEATTGKCEECGESVPDIDLTNVMAGVPMEIIAVCTKCLDKLEEEA